uniref:Uncharacterized protein n=1 Tax=Ditylenchus dipsaci TaxID=166011 RepID=A0A915D0I8_9BILA
MNASIRRAIVGNVQPCDMPEHHPTSMCLEFRKAEEREMQTTNGVEHECATMTCHPKVKPSFACALKPDD